MGKRIHLKGDFRMSVNTVVYFLRLLVLQALDRSLERYVKQLIVNEPHYIIEYCDISVSRCLHVIFASTLMPFQFVRRVYVSIFHYLKLSNLNRIQCFELSPPCVASLSSSEYFSTKGLLSTRRFIYLLTIS